MTMFKNEKESHNSKMEKENSSSRNTLDGITIQECQWLMEVSRVILELKKLIDLEFNTMSYEEFKVRFETRIDELEKLIDS